MTSRRKIDRDEIGIGITHAVQVHRGIQARSLRSSNRWKRTQEVVETNSCPPSDATPSFHEYQTRDLLMNYKPILQILDGKRLCSSRGQTLQRQLPVGNVARVWSGAVVVVEQMSNLRLAVSGRQPSGVSTDTWRAHRQTLASCRESSLSEASRR